MKEIIGDCDQVLEQMEEPLILYHEAIIDDVPESMIYYAVAEAEDKLFSLIGYDGMGEDDNFNYYIHDNIDLSDYYRLF